MNIDLELEMPCQYVDWQTGEYCARGKVYKKGQLYPKKNAPVCPTCKGTGYVPTQFGQEILDFIRKYKP